MAASVSWSSWWGVLPIVGGLAMLLSMCSREEKVKGLLVISIEKMYV